jgi:hypothetical protein
MKKLYEIYTVQNKTTGEIEAVAKSFEDAEETLEIVNMMTVEKYEIYVHVVDFSKGQIAIKGINV